MSRDLTFEGRFQGSRRRLFFIVTSLAGLLLSLMPVLPVQAATLTVCASGCECSSPTMLSWIRVMGCSRNLKSRSSGRDAGKRARLR